MMNQELYFQPCTVSADRAGSGNFSAPGNRRAHSSFGQQQPRLQKSDFCFISDSFVVLVPAAAGEKSPAPPRGSVRDSHLSEATKSRLIGGSPHKIASRSILVRGWSGVGQGGAVPADPHKHWAGEGWSGWSGQNKNNTHARAHARARSSFSLTYLLNKNNPDHPDHPHKSLYLCGSAGTAPTLTNPDQPLTNIKNGSFLWPPSYTVSLAPEFARD